MKNKKETRKKALVRESTTVDGDITTITQMPNGDFGFLVVVRKKDMGEHLPVLLGKAKLIQVNSDAGKF